MKTPEFIEQINAGVKNIIFDFGGIIINIDYVLTIKAFQNLGIANFAEIFTQAQQTDVFDRLDKGEITPQAFRDKVRAYAPSLGLTDKQIDDAWNAMLLDMPMERLKVLSALKPNYRMFLLSNTNEIHVDYFSETINRAVGKNDLSDYFEKIYYSNEIGMRKPNADIFEFVLRENGLNAGETLFIDDSVQHIEGARRLGIHAYHLTNGETINNLFADILE